VAASGSSGICGALHRVDAPFEAQIWLRFSL
jgi:hypothetical protein